MVLDQDHLCPLFVILKKKLKLSSCLLRLQPKVGNYPYSDVYIKKKNIVCFFFLMFSENKYLRHLTLSMLASQVLVLKANVLICKFLNLT